MRKRRGRSLGWKGSESVLHLVPEESKTYLRCKHLFFRIGWRGFRGGGVQGLMGNRTLDPTEPSICSAINLPPSLSLCSFTHPAIYPSSPVAKGPCLFVALIIWTNFLCNLFPSQPPTWSSSIKLLKVEPLIPASPFPPIISCFFSSPSLCRLKFQRWQPSLLPLL